MVFGLIVLATACGPVKKPAVDPSSSDDTSTSSKADPPETWGSSETASAGKSGSSGSSASSGGSKPAGGGAASAATTPASTPSAPADSGPHVPDSLGGASYDRAALEVALKRAARQVKANCGAATDDTGAASGPWGKTNVTIKLGHNGHSKGGSVPAPFDGKPVGKCVAQAFSNVIYAPFPGPDTDVDWPVEVTKP